MSKSRVFKSPMSTKIDHEENEEVSVLMNSDDDTLMNIRYDGYDTPSRRFHL